MRSGPYANFGTVPENARRENRKMQVHNGLNLTGVALAIGALVVLAMIVIAASKLGSAVVDGLVLAALVS